MAVSDSITPQELYNNYEYKVTVKALKREYPWIINVGVDESKINEYNLIFIDVYYDPFTVEDEYGWSISRWTKNAIDDGMEYYSPYLSTAFDVSYETAKDITDDIDEMMKGINKSPAMPYDLKLPGTRKLAIGRWIIPAHFKDTHGIPPPTTPEDIT